VHEQAAFGQPVVVPKGWGCERWLHNSDLYCLKELLVLAGKKCSWHYHKLKTETFWLVGGELIVRVLSPGALRMMASGKLTAEAACRSREHWQECVLTPHGRTVHLSPGTLHQFQAVTDSYLMEGSTRHFDEDSYRIVRGD
jgi:D-lyxose ketol-isomerase